MSKLTLLEICQILAPTISAPRPLTVISNTEGSVIQMLEFVRAACDDLLVDYDWQFLQKEHTFTTVQDQEEYDLPTDFRCIINSSFFNVSDRTTVNGSLTPAQWQANKLENAPSNLVSYRLRDDKILVYPATGGIDLIFEYMSNCGIKSSGGVPKTTLTEDSDVIQFDHRVVIYLARLKWLESKGRDTTNALVEFNRSVERAKGENAPASIISASGSRRTITHNVPTWAS